MESACRLHGTQHQVLIASFCATQSCGLLCLLMQPLMNRLPPVLHLITSEFFTMLVNLWHRLKVGKGLSEGMLREKLLPRVLLCQEILLRG